MLTPVASAYSAGDTSARGTVVESSTPRNASSSIASGRDASDTDAARQSRSSSTAETTTRRDTINTR